MVVVGEVCLEIRFTLQRKYAQRGSQDHSRKACMQTMKHCTGNCSRICKVSRPSCSARDKTGVVVSSPFLFHYRSFPLFATCTAVKVLFPISVASFLPAVSCQEWMSLPREGRSERSRITTHKRPALKPQVRCRSFSHCFAAFYFSFYSSG